MKVRVDYFPYQEKFGKSYGTISLNIENIFFLRHMFLMEGTNGVWISKPQKKEKDGKYTDNYFFTSDVIKKIIEGIKDYGKKCTFDIEIECKEEKKEEEFPFDD